MPDGFPAIGKVIAGAQTTRQAMERGGLDWQTERCPIEVAVPLTEHGQTLSQNLGEVEAVVRSHDRKVLGLVSSQYHLFQNTDVFQFLDVIIAKGYILPRRVGTFHDDKILWMIFELPQPIYIRRHRDPYEREQTIRKYFMVSMTHDRNSSVAFHMLPVREDDGALLNFLPLGPEARLTHHSHDSQEVKRGVDAYVATATKFGEFAKTCQALSEGKITHSGIERWLKSARWDQKTYINKAFDLFYAELFENSTLSAVAAMCKQIDSRAHVRDDLVEKWMTAGPRLKQHAFLRLADFI